MYLWTQKAEDDFRARHPGIKEKDVYRRAGQPATYDGKPLQSKEIANAFKMRGWIVEKSANKPAYQPKAVRAEWEEWKKRFKESVKHA